MNVRIFWVHIMECMCAQTRPRFILSSERVLGNGVRTHVNSEGKLHSAGGSEEGRTCDAASRRTESPTHYRRPLTIYDTDTLPVCLTSDTQQSGFQPSLTNICDMANALSIVEKYPATLCPALARTINREWFAGSFTWLDSMQEGHNTSSPQFQAW